MKNNPDPTNSLNSGYGAAFPESPHLTALRLKLPVYELNHPKSLSDAILYQSDRLTN